jgi:hypothetical protein
MTELNATNLTPPVTLTDAEAEAVAGGLALVVGRLGGCPTCTSGGYLDPRAAIAQVINPAESAVSIGAAGG